jgi:uncharacterized protein RhaS with RHS repeats
MQQRYYDPQIGRFLSVDPVETNTSNGFNFNRYWYANNNPYKFTDPDGRAPPGCGDGTCSSSPAQVESAMTMIVATVFMEMVDMSESMAQPGGDSHPETALFTAIIEDVATGAGVEAKAETTAASESSVAAGGRQPLMGRNDTSGPSSTRHTTDAGPNGNRATAKSIFRNQAEGKKTTTTTSGGGTRTRAENGVQIRLQPNGSARVDLPNRGTKPNGETIHTPPKEDLLKR